MKHIFIVNKISGKGKALKNAHFIEEICKNNKIDYQIIYTEKVKDAEEIAKRYTAIDNVVIYSVGGDGTLYEIINGLNEDVPLAVLPLGSGNDFYRLIDTKHDIAKLIQDTINAPIKKIDYATCNDHKWINVTSFGIDAEVNYYASKLIRKSFIAKGPAYIISIIKNVLLNLTAHHYIINVDGKIIEDDFYIVAVLNGRYYGNGVPACPDALINDGYLDLCLVKKVPFHKVYPFLIAYMQGKHLNRKEFVRIKAQNIVIDCDREVAYQSDGENDMTNHVEICIKKGAISLKTPNYPESII